jgi:hypothetical protein
MQRVMIPHRVAQNIQAKLENLSLLLRFRIHQSIEQEYADASILHHHPNELRLPRKYMEDLHQIAHKDIILSLALDERGNARLVPHIE